MSTIKSYTDLEQSKKLAEFLPIESADMYYSYYHNPISGASFYEEYPIFHIPINKNKSLPCWSLASLFGVLPDELEDNHFLTLDKEGNEYCCCYEDGNGNSFKHTFADNPVDACVEMIENLHKLNLL